MTELGLTDDSLKDTASPRVKRTEAQMIEDRESSLSNPEDVRDFKLEVIRLSYLDHDRADMSKVIK